MCHRLRSAPEFLRMECAYSIWTSGSCFTVSASVKLLVDPDAPFDPVTTGDGWSAKYSPKSERRGTREHVLLFCGTFFLIASMEQDLTACFVQAAPYFASVTPANS